MSTKKLFVHGFRSSMDEESRRTIIEELFGQYGEIVNVAIIRDKERGGLKSFCFVEMDSDAADKAIDNLDGFESRDFEGYEGDEFTLAVNEAKPQESRDNRHSRSKF